ncbi:hypothetical protein HA402_008003 [Bradysia odoriphaga]|nr:hypothetical protein HA402_008003 [Bradysia odoriphaga]
MTTRSTKSGSLNENSNEAPEDFECDGAARERSKWVSKRPKGSFKKLNSNNRLHGAGYIKFYTCNLVPPKSIGQRCAGNCKMIGKECHTFSDDDRKQIFEAFYGLDCAERQRDFICRHVVSEPKKECRAGESSRRSNTNTYFLTIRRKRTKVCKRFFLGTLAISETVVRTALRKITDVGTIEPEKRGGRVESNQQRDSLISSLVNAHIDRFPRIESHFCRQNTNRDYLSADLTLARMHRMYCAEQSDEKSMVSYTYYSQMFHDKNLSFHHPKKDQCTLCVSYRTGDQSTKENLHEEYHLHIAEKNAVRKIKEKCKKESIESQEVATPVFDLEQVFTFPMSPESLVFYKRRLTAFNLTVYELGSRDCDCFFWDETQSRRGSSEIGTCVFLYLKDLDERRHTKVNLFADGCPGQNKNTIIAAMLLYFIRQSKNVKEVSLRYFVTNHGQNEGDSAHSTISTAMDSKAHILVPSLMPNIIATARNENPYKVHSLGFTDFLDFKAYSQLLNILSVRKNDDGNGSINWTDVMEIRVEKHSPKTLFYKNSHCCDEYKSITLKKSLDIDVDRLNAEPIKISAAKYNDLTSLCTGNIRVIRDNSHVEFYKNLPHCDK